LGNAQTWIFDAGRRRQFAGFTIGFPSHELHKPRCLQDKAPAKKLPAQGFSAGAWFLPQFGLSIFRAVAHAPARERT